MSAPAITLGPTTVTLPAGVTAFNVAKHDDRWTITYRDLASCYESNVNIEFTAPASGGFVFTPAVSLTEYVPSQHKRNLVPGDKVHVQLLGNSKPQQATIVARESTDTYWIKFDQHATAAWLYTRDQLITDE